MEGPRVPRETTLLVNDASLEPELSSEEHVRVNTVTSRAQEHEEAALFKNLVTTAKLRYHLYAPGSVLGKPKKPREVLLEVAQKQTVPGGRALGVGRKADEEACEEDACEEASKR